MSKRTMVKACLVSVVVVTGLALVYVYFIADSEPLHFRQDQSASVIGNTAPSSSLSVLVRDVPEGYREYRSDTFRFSVLYPEHLEVNERKEDSRASTITFQNVEKEEGFQIFIAPFFGSQISPEQFKKDAPSGVRDDMRDVAIDGALGASFHGLDLALGDTSEVWFLHEGYLYEVTAMRHHEPLLQAIMETWKFIQPSSLIHEAQP